jgi:hypoxanthine phosphoribosyltransferase
MPAAVLHTPDKETLGRRTLMSHQEQQSEVGRFYSYEKRKGILPISWEDYFALCKGLAVAISAYDPEIILGIARGGLYAATLLSHMLQAEFYVVRITRRLKDQVVYDAPVWLVKPPEVVRDKRVLIVDEICSAGITLGMVKEEVEKLRAREIRSAVLYAHEQGKAIPDYIGIISDALILNPWDREIIQEGKFVFHPEYGHALAQQGMIPDRSLLLGLDPLPLAKGSSSIR